MTMTMSSNTSFLLGLGVVLLFIATPVAAFGAGDIVDVANINDINYRHGDIENTLLELIITAGSNTKFEKLDVKRVYFGNWLRDYSQAIDVGGLKQLPADTIRILLWCLSFMTFGYATGEFEVTADRLGCYRPEEHIDNPKDYADNEDARQYDQRLRGPVDEGKELRIDPETGLKVYIASENAGCDTSAGLVRKLFEKSIELGRKYHRDNNKADFYEALRLLGTGLHCLEDYSAHSNYTELALKELGVDVFPHVGKRTELEVKGKRIFPLVTGTFGMTDFLHSVVGEMGDKVAQSEIEDLDSKLTQASEDDQQNDQGSVLKSILDKIPWEMLEGDGEKPDPSKADELKQASQAKAEDSKNHPLDSNVSLGGVSLDEARDMAQQTLKDMYPILEFHDQIMKGVTAVTSKVPGLDEATENISGALQIFIYSLLAPFLKPIIAQARAELKSTSEGVLKTSLKGQYEVFENENSTDPTHSMLSKDHFSNVLNPVAGQIACATVKFVVPHIVESWSDEGKDVRQVIDDILQIFHHPALRDENREGQRAMFETVKKWWEGKNQEEQQHLKEILSFDGVKEGKNHEGHTEEGGHSHGAPPKKNNQSSFVPSAQEGAGFLSGLAGGVTNMVLEETGLDKTFGKVERSRVEGSGHQQQQQNQQHESSSSGRQEETSSYGRNNESSSYGRNNDNESSSYGRNNENETSSYGRKNENESSSYGRNNDNESSSYGRNDDNQTSSYGRNNANESSSYGRKNDNETSSYGRNNENETSSYGRNNENETSSYGRNNENETSSYGRNNESSSYGRNNDNETSSYGRNNDNETSSYGRNENESSSYNRNDNESSSYGRNNDNESSSYGRNNDNEESSYGGGNSRRNESSSYGGGREESSGYGGGREESSGYGGGREESSGYGGGREESSGYGGRDNEDRSGGRRYGEEENSRY